VADRLVLKAKGIYTQANNKSAVPDGALLEAKNVVIDKDDLIEPRRGFKLFGDAVGSSTTTLNQLLSYDDRILRQYETNATTGFLERQNTPGGESFTKASELRLLELSSLTSTGTAVTAATISAHGLATGDSVVIAGAADAEYNGSFTATVTSTTEFTYTAASAPAVSPDTGDSFLLEATANDILEPDSGVKIQSAEVNGNLYFTTKEGVKKLDAFNSTIVPAGVPKALDFTVELDNTTSANWFADDQQRGYRVVWGIKDANNNLILGAGSSRSFITNPNAGIAQATKLTISIPENLTTAHFYQIYRTSGSPDEATPPSEDYQLVYEDNPSYADLAAGELSVLDIQLDLYRGAAFYQNDTQEGDGQANTQPPFAKDIALYNNITFYANTKTRHQFSLDLTGLDFILPEYTISTISVDTAAVVTTSEAHGLTSGQSVDITGTNSTPVIDGTRVVTVLSATTFSVPVTTSGAGSAGTVTDTNTTVTFTGSSTTFDITFASSENLASGVAKKFTSGTVAENIEDTARSIIRAINGATANSIVTSSYVSMPNDPPGKIVIESRELNDGGFTLQAFNAFSGGFSAFNPALTNATNSENNEKTNRLYYSKLNEPEAVPALNFFRVGGGDTEIVRIKALRDSLFVFTTEGIFRVTGSTPQQLNLSGFDQTAKIEARESVATLNNTIYVFTDQGITSVSDTGVSIVSRQIEDQLLNLLDPDFTSFSTATFGVAYQSDRKYILFTVKDEADTTATIAFVYNTITEAWTTWDLSKTCGIVNSFDDKLYLGASDTNYMEQERKEFNYKDHADRQHNINVTAVSNQITQVQATSPAIITATNHGLENGDIITIRDCDAIPSIDDVEYEITIIDSNTFTIPAAVTGAGTTGTWSALNREVPVSLEVDIITNIQVGDIIEQSLSRTVVTPSGSTTYSYELESEVVAVDTDNLLVTMNRNLRFQVDSAIVYDGYEKKVTYAPVHAGNPAATKHFRQAHVMFDDYRGSEISLIFNSETSRTEDTTSIEINLFGNWGMFSWGELAWGGDPYEEAMRTIIPRNKQRCRLLNVTYKTSVAREKWELEGIALYYRMVSDRTGDP